MRLTKLILENFRNHDKLELNFDAHEPLTSIVGPNGQGKTNILEAMYLLALTKSFRTSNHQEMIGWGHEYARVSGFFADPAADSRTGHPSAQADSARPEEQTTRELQSFLGHPPQPQKVFKINGVKTPATKFISTLQVVFFHPEDLNMLYLGPDLRRTYLNILNTQINAKYFHALRQYNKALKQRNALLKAIKDQLASPSDLDVWDSQLVDHGSLLINERNKTADFINEHLSETYQKISHGDEKLTLTYKHAHNLQQELKDARGRDLKALITTVGPHRDDLEFAINGLQLQASASRGEYRSLLLALKLIELKFFQDRTGQNPLLLLDDVFSELDPQRQNLLMKAIEGHQTIITTTHLDAPTVEDAAPRQHRKLAPTTRQQSDLQILHSPPQ